MNCFSAQAMPLTISFPSPPGIEPVVLVHGGAGDIADETIPAKRDGVKLAARIGYETLRQTGSVLDAVQEAVCSMELNAYFNCGYGSALTWNGKVEMEAAIMNGADLQAGCVSLVRDINHPIVLARRILQNTPHCYLVGEGAMAFAAQQGFEILADCALVTPGAAKALQDYTNGMTQSPLAPQIGEQLPLVFPGQQQECECYPFPCSTCQKNLFGGDSGGADGCAGGCCSSGLGGGHNLGGGGGSPGTVGAVAIDRFGNVAAATSTGGLTGKMTGRVGDSPILGGGTYADNSSGAVSCTGHGETVMRFNVAARTLAQIRLGGQSAQQAATMVMSEMVGRLNECTAGVICVDRNGGVGIEFAASRMPWAYLRDIQMHYGVEKGEDCVELLGPATVEACQQNEFKCCCK